MLNGELLLSHSLQIKTACVIFSVCKTFRALVYFVDVKAYHFGRVLLLTEI